MKARVAAMSHAATDETVRPALRGERDAASAVLRSELAAVALILLGAALLFLVGLGQSTLWDQDEAKYTQIAREILQTRDPITLHLNGAPWFVHPPLYLWLQAVTGWLFGFNEFTARVWSAIFGVLGVLATIRLGRLLFTPRAGLLAGVVVMTTFQFFAQSRLAIFDGALVVLMLLAFEAFLRGLRTAEPHLIVWAGIWAGLGTLTKGPIALLLPGMVAAAFLALRRPAVSWRRLPWMKAAAAYLLTAAPWYLVEWVRHGWPFIGQIIGYYTLTRFFGVVEEQSGPWWYYAPVFGLGTFPWTALFVAMLLYQVRRRAHDGSLLVVLWIGITVVFFSLAGTKLPNYVLPVYPMAAVGIAAVWDRLFAGEGMARRYVNAAFIFTVGAVALFAFEIAAFGRLVYPAEFAALQRHLFTVGIAVGGWLLFASALYALRRPAESFAVLAATTVLLAGALIGRTLPLVEAHRPIKTVAAALRPELQPGTALAAVNLTAQQTLLFYTDHRVLWVDDAEGLRPLLCRHRRIVIVARTNERDSVMRYLQFYVPAPLRVIVQQGGLTAIRKEGEIGCRRRLPAL